MRTARRRLAIGVMALAMTTSGLQAGAQDTNSRPGTTTVLFMCPRGAAKSVLASAYFQQLAKERGLSVRVHSAGTDPDATVSPAVAAHLTKQGYAVPTAPPRQASSDDLAAADVVISIGCDLTGLPQPRGALQRWDDVPALSDNFARADEAIRARVVALVDELVRAAAKEK